MRITLVPTLFLVLATGIAGAADTGSNPVAPIDDSGLSPVSGQRASETADKAVVDAAVERAKQLGVAKLSDAELALVRGSGAHVLWRRAVAEQQRRSGDAKSADDNDSVADLDAYYMPDAERTRRSGPKGLMLEMMRDFHASSAVIALRAAGDNYAALNDHQVAALDAVRLDLRADVADAVAAEVARRPEVRRIQMQDAAWRSRAAGDHATADAWERMADDEGRLHPVVETLGVVAADWQGTAALVRLTRSGEPAFALGLGVERLSIDDEPVVGAVEAVIRGSLPFPVTGRLALGPAIAGRIGATFDGDLVVGIDVSLHAEYALAYGLGATLDVGAGQRGTEHAASDFQPAASFGILTVF